MFVALLAGLVVALYIYLFVRKVVYSWLDPLVVGLATIAMSAMLITYLYLGHSIEPSVPLNFFVVLTGFLVGALWAGKGFDIDSFRDSIAQVVNRFSRNEVLAVFWATMFLTLILAILGILYGAAGDARQEFGRTWRPLMLVQNGFFLLWIVMLLSREISLTARGGMIILLIVLSIPFSGKSVFFPLLYWMGLWAFLEKRAIGKFGLTVLLFVGGGGICTCCVDWIWLRQHF